MYGTSERSFKRNSERVFEFLLGRVTLVEAVCVVFAAGRRRARFDGLV